MRKEWFFDRIFDSLIAVYAEDGKIVEVGVESSRSSVAVGNIYKGTVANVVPGMQAAFISCGLERNCYLPLDEGSARFSSYDGAGKSDGGLKLKEGDEILVQIVKLPRGNKGAKVSSDLSIVGKTLIFLPRTDFLGISRKITDRELRTNLLKEADKLRGEGEGFIVRTAAAEAAKRQLKAESEYLKRMSRAMEETAASAPVGSVVYREIDLPVRIMRDSLGSGVNKIVVGDRELYERIARLARLRADVGEKKVALHPGPRSMFAQYDLSDQIHALADPVVPLPSGGHLVIDHTEAMTVIDVNTGKYTGDSDLESTVFETDLEAAREIARQLVLRNIGGIVAIDFIDMAEEKHRLAVDEELACALARDRAKCRSYPMTEMCVSLLTRKRVGSELRSFLLQPSRAPSRQGYVLSDRYLAMRIRSAVIDVFAAGSTSAIVSLHPDVMRTILSDGLFTDELRGRWRDKRLYFIPHPEYHPEKFTAEGESADVLTLPDTACLAY